MMNEFNALKKGFMKQAQDFGLTEKQALAVFEKHANISDVSAWLGRNINELTPNGIGIDHASATLGLPIAGAGIGGIAGGSIGGIAGALNGTKDEKGETHRIKNALKGLLIGGTLGAGTGGLAGAAGSASIASDPMAYQTAAMGTLVRRQADQAAETFTRPVREGLNQGAEFFKKLVR
jgi:hypothetical protein